MMNAERIEEIRKRAEAATPGPWEVGYDDYDSDTTLYIGEVEATVGRFDAEFIAHAREDIPALLAEVDRLNKEVAEAWEYYEKLQKDYAVLAEKELKELGYDD